MTERGGVPLLDGGHGRVHEPLEQPLDAFVELAVLDGDGRLSRQGRHQFHESAGEGPHLPAKIVHGLELRLELPLAIQQLQHADDLVPMVAHRERQHGLRAIVVLLVDETVDAVLDVRRQLIGVVEDHRVTRAGHVSGDAGVVDRDGELDERDFGSREILRHLESQPLGAVFR